MANLGLPSGVEPTRPTRALAEHGCSGGTRAAPLPRLGRTLTTNTYCCADLAVNSGLHSPMHRSTGPELIPGSACPISQTILEAETPR